MNSVAVSLEVVSLKSVPKLFDKDQHAIYAPVVGSEVHQFFDAKYQLEDKQRENE